VIQIRRDGLTSDADEVGRLRSEFSEVQCTRLSQLLEPTLLGFLQRRLEEAEWEPKTHVGIGEELITNDLLALHLLNFVANLHGFRKLIEEVTGCGPLRRFRGRIYRMSASAGHLDSWHDDNCDNRLIGMSLNLSPLPYCGGIFQLREWESQRMLAEVANTGLGDALVFRISAELEHRVSPMEGAEAKTAFAGWFRPDLPDLFDEVRGADLGKRS